MAANFLVDSSVCPIRLGNLIRRSVAPGTVTSVPPYTRAETTLDWGSRSNGLEVSIICFDFFLDVFPRDWNPPIRV